MLFRNPIFLSAGLALFQGLTWMFAPELLLSEDVLLPVGLAAGLPGKASLLFLGFAILLWQLERDPKARTRSLLSAMLICLAMSALVLGGLLLNVLGGGSWLALPALLILTGGLAVKLMLERRVVRIEDGVVTQAPAYRRSEA